jgi:hypothetical protein
MLQTRLYVSESRLYDLRFQSRQKPQTKGQDYRYNEISVSIQRNDQVVS